MKAYNYAQKMTKRELEAWLGKADAAHLLEHNGDGFVLDPDVVYPAALAYLAEVAEGKVDLPTYIDRGRQEAVRSISPETWLAVANGTYDGASDTRDGVIDTARRIFTAMLREQSGGPLALKIVKGESGKWKLANPNVVGI